MLLAKVPDGERVGMQLKGEISASVMIFVTSNETQFLLSLTALYIHVFASFSIFLPCSYVLYFTHPVFELVPPNIHSYTKANMKNTSNAAHYRCVFHVSANTATCSYEDKYKNTHVSFCSRKRPE